MVTYRLNLDVKKGGIQAVINAKQGNNNSITLISNFISDGEVLDLDGCTVNLYCDKADGKKVYLTYNDKVVLTDQVFAVPGTVKAEFQIIKGNKTLYSPTIAIHVSQNVYDEDAVRSSSEWKVLEELIESIRSKVDTTVFSDVVAILNETDRLLEDKINSKADATAVTDKISCEEFQQEKMRLLNKLDSYLPKGEGLIDIGLYPTNKLSVSQTSNFSAYIAGSYELFFNGEIYTVYEGTVCSDPVLNNNTESSYVFDTETARFGIIATDKIEDKHIELVRTYYTWGVTGPQIERMEAFEIEEKRINYDSFSKFLTDYIENLSSLNETIKNEKQILIQLLNQHTGEVRPHPNQINSYQTAVNPNDYGLVGKKGDICFESVDGNLLVNSQFENDLNGWENPSAIISVKQDGNTYYAECAENNDMVTALLQRFVIEKPRAYTLKFKNKGVLWFHVVTDSWKTIIENTEAKSPLISTWNDQSFTFIITNEHVGACKFEVLGGQKAWSLTEVTITSDETPPTRLWRYEDGWVPIGYVNNDPNPSWNSVTGKPDIVTQEDIENVTKPVEHKATYNSDVQFTYDDSSFTKVGNFVNAVLNLGVKDCNSWGVQLGTLPAEVVPKGLSVAVNAVTNEGKPCYIYFDNHSQGADFGLRLQNTSDTLGTDGIRANVTYLIKG